MAKTIFKEIIIMLLICLAIILVLGIGLYEFIPIAKTLPAEVAYTAPEDIKVEIEELSDIQEQGITYKIDSTELNNYKRTKDYKPGKANPFAAYNTTSENGTNTTTNNSTTGGTSNSSNNSSNSNDKNTNVNNNTSGGSFFQDKGTK